MMPDKIGYVYDEYEFTLKGDLEDYIESHAEEYKTGNKKIKRYYFNQKDFYGVSFTAEFEDGSQLVLDEKEITKIVSELYEVPFDKIFADTGSEIFYMFTLQGIDE